MKSLYEKIKNFPLVANIIWSISGGCVALLLVNNFNFLTYSHTSNSFYPLLLLIIFLLAVLIFFLSSIVLKNIFRPFVFKSKLLEAFRVYITVSFVAVHAVNFYHYGLVGFNSEPILGVGHQFAIACSVGLVSLYAVWVGFGILFKLIYKILLFIQLTKNEKKLLFIYTTANIVLIILTSFLTDIFYQVDAIFSLDTGVQLTHDVLNNTSTMFTGIRHMGESVITSPIGALTKSFGEVMWFVPNGQYLIPLAIFNVLIVLSAILLVRMLGLQDRFYKIAFYIFYLCSFPVQLFSAAFEQYVPGVFFLILFVFILWSTNKKRRGLNYGALSSRNLEYIKFLSLVASGLGVLTSFFAALLLIGRKLGESVKNLAKVVGVFLVFILATGQGLTVLYGYQEYIQLKSFMNLSYGERVEMYSHFVVNTLTNVTAYFGPLKYVIGNGVADSARTMQSVSVIGILLFIVTLFGVYLGIRKGQVLAYASALWIVLSIIVLVLFGWGATNNEMTLYSYYFSFAFIFGIFTALMWLVEKVKTLGVKPRYVLMILFVPIIAVSLLSFGVRAKIVKYGSVNYPVNAKEFIKNAN